MNRRKEIAALASLISVSGLGPVRLKKMLDHYESATNILNAIQAGQTFGLPTSIQAELRALKLEKGEELITLCEKHAIDIVAWGEKEYPRRLQDIADGPPLLFYKGDIKCLRDRPLAIVGTRKISDHGRYTLEQEIVRMADMHPVIISGLAYGTDITAHRACLAHGITTAAVLANGLDEVYPSEHHRVANRIIEDGGVVISEKPPKTKLDPRFFPMRNRIIAGLSEATIVVESNIKGGSMITASLAFDYNREVYAFPGRISDPNSKGTNHLIATQRAQLYTGIEQLAEDLRWHGSKKRATAQIMSSLTIEEQAILQTLDKYEDMSIDELLSLSGMSESEFAGVLLQLEMKSLIRTRPGKRIALTH